MFCDESVIYFILINQNNEKIINERDQILKKFKNNILNVGFNIRYNSIYTGS